MPAKETLEECLARIKAQTAEIEKLPKGRERSRLAYFFRVVGPIHRELRFPLDTRN